MALRLTKHQPERCTRDRMHSSTHS